MENTGKEGSDLKKKESPVNECSGFNSIESAFEDNRNLSHSASSEFECGCFKVTLPRRVSRLNKNVVYSQVALFIHR